MNHQKYTWESIDGLHLFGQSWMPDNKPKAVIDYVHGFRDHSGRFEKWALQLTENGYGLVAIDLRGHGRSSGRRGCAESFDKYLDDVQVLCHNSNNIFNNIQHILYGQSLGGNIVTNYLLSGKQLPSAAIITSPWFTLASSPPLIKLLLARTFRFLAPGMTVKSDLDANSLSRDKKVVEEYLNDPLVHNSILPRLFFEIEENGLKASRCIYKINLPLLVMHGTSDRITSLSQTLNFVMNAGNLTTFKEWSGYYHELHNDTGAADVFSFLLNWLNKQTSSNI
jgi:alpha-beta hydrolase superfamily lysophospholipase